MTKKEIKSEVVDIKKFDELAKNGQFIEGPFIDSFGDGYGDPYTPRRRVWGTLAGGQQIESTKHFGASEHA